MAPPNHFTSLPTLIFPFFPRVCSCNISWERSQIWIFLWCILWYLERERRPESSACPLRFVVYTCEFWFYLVLIFLHFRSCVGSRFPVVWVNPRQWFFWEWVRARLNCICAEFGSDSFCFVDFVAALFSARAFATGFLFAGLVAQTHEARQQRYQSRRWYCFRIRS
jgi:hypothetical protein